MVALPSNSALLCYYLFFPGSDGGLEGCDGAIAKLFDNFAGQWTCVAVLLEGKTPPGVGQRTAYEPKWLGMTSRAPDMVTTPRTEAKHFGMVARNWSLVPNIKRDRGAGQAQGEHPLIFVARQTHGFYLSPGPQPTQPPAGNDIARNSCGQYESFELSRPRLKRQMPVLSESRSNGRRTVGSSGFSSLAGRLEPSLALDTPAALPGWPNWEVVVHQSRSKRHLQFDHPPDAGNYGFVIHPKDLMLAPFSPVPP